MMTRGCVRCLIMKKMEVDRQCSIYQGVGRYCQQNDASLNPCVKRTPGESTQNICSFIQDEQWETIVVVQHKVSDFGDRTGVVTAVDTSRVVVIRWFNYLLWIAILSNEELSDVHTPLKRTRCSPTRETQTFSKIQLRGHRRRRHARE